MKNLISITKQYSKKAKIFEACLSMFYSIKSANHLLTYYNLLFNNCNSHYEFQSLKNTFDVLIEKANTSRRKQIFDQVKREVNTLKCFYNLIKRIHAKEKQFQENQYQDFLYD